MKLQRGFFSVVLILSCLFPALLQAAIPIPEPPSLKAKAHLMIDMRSGQVLASDNAFERLEPASLTKLMTVYVVLSEIRAGHIGMQDEVRVSEHAWRQQGSRMFLDLGSRVKVEELLKGVIVQSGNDATAALAEYVAGAEDSFAGMMNSYAEKLGMKDSHFMNSSGLPDPEHYSTAHDLSLLATALIHDFPDVYPIFSIREYTHNKITQKNRNKLLWRNPYVDGLKTGHTKAAGYCLVASAEKDGMRLITVIMGAGSAKARVTETQKLLSYAFRFYLSHRLFKAGDPVVRSKLWKGSKDSVALGLKHDLYVTLPQGMRDQLKTSYQLPAQLEAPVRKGQGIGQLKVVFNGQSMALEQLYALETVPEAGLGSRMVDEVLMFFE